LDEEANQMLEDFAINGSYIKSTCQPGTRRQKLEFHKSENQQILLQTL